MFFSIWGTVILLALVVFVIGGALVGWATASSGDGIKGMTAGAAGGGLIGLVVGIIPGGIASFWITLANAAATAANNLG